MIPKARIYGEVRKDLKMSALLKVDYGILGPKA